MNLLTHCDVVVGVVELASFQVVQQWRRCVEDATQLGRAVLAVLEERTCRVPPPSDTMTPRLCRRCDIFIIGRIAVLRD